MLPKKDYGYFFSDQKSSNLYNDEDEYIKGDCLNCVHHVSCVDHHPFGSTFLEEDNSYCGKMEMDEDCEFEERDA